MNPALRAHNLMDLLEDLISVLERENALLERPRSAELQPILKEKQALFKLYDDQMTVLARDPGFAAALPEDIRERLTALATGFDAVMQKNRRKLELMTKSSKHIVNRIVEAAKGANGRVPQYGRRGKVYEGTTAAPVAMNQEV